MDDRECAGEPWPACVSSLRGRECFFIERERERKKERERERKRKRERENVRETHTQKKRVKEIENFSWTIESALQNHGRPASPVYADESVFGEREREREREKEIHTQKERLRERECFLGRSRVRCRTMTSV